MLFEPFVPHLAYIFLAQRANEYIVFDMLVQVLLLPGFLCPVSVLETEDRHRDPSFDHDLHVHED